MSDRPVLVTGAAGLLGHWLLATAPDRASVVALVHRRPVDAVATVRGDLRDAAGVTDAVASIAPRLVVHAAYEMDRASVVDATLHLVAAARAADAPVVFVSSDTVFRGDGIDRCEDDPPDPTFEYGRWKADAERIVVEGCRNGAVVRLPLLVSIDPDDHSLLRIRVGVAAGHATGWYTDEIRRPVRAGDAADGIWRIAQLADDERAGCWHLVGPERLSRHDIARRMVERLELPESAIEPALRPDGDRPADLALTDARARGVIGWDPEPIP
ncbi:MAG TPA: sugar nucleotide-binding protein [Ilumatobacter sp.]|nr:sugar nucleotide-binding protein [Ilumatobacter sp.]